MKYFGVLIAFTLTVCQLCAQSISLLSSASSTGESIALLEEYLEKSTGIKPVVADKAADGLNIKLELRESMAAEPEAFVLEFPAENSVVIAGATPLAVRHGVCEFLERFYGIRWLYSGKNGEYVPKVTGIPAFPKQAIRQSPVYKVRTFALVHKMKQDYVWAAKNKGIFSYDLYDLPGYTWFHHNMLNLLPSSKYGQTHPQFFPIRDGKRLIPAQGENVYWQHCYSADGIVDELVNVTNNYFAKNSKRSSLSFGVNDGGRYCECAKCLAVDGKFVDSVGFPNHGTSYLKCISAVADRCAAPGRTFGFLAYSGIREVPAGMKINSALRPYFTNETLFWADPARAEDAKRITRAWANANGSKVGWYDYLEHSWFQIPKISLTVTPGALRWGAANNVIHYYAELLPAADWHTGPMPYLVLKLLWNPEQSVDALLDDWCKAAVGEKAAPYLKKYYQGCSDFWEKEVPKTAFFKEKFQRQYLGKSSGYLDAVSIEWLDLMKSYLDKVVELASDERKDCAKDIRKTFTDREMMIRTYVKNNKLRKEAANMKFRKSATFNFDRKGTWPTWQRATSKGEFFYAPGEGMDKSGAQAMNLEKSYRNMVYMITLKAVPKRIYRITAYVRTKAVDSAARADLSIAWSAPAKAWLDPAFNASDSLEEDGSFAWRKLTVVVAAPDVAGCAMRIMLSAGNSTKGIFYWDNVTVEEVDDGAPVKKEVNAKPAAPKVSEAELKNEKLLKEAEAMKFKRIGIYIFNSKGTWSTWQRPQSKGKFYHAPGEGINKSGAQAMDMTGTFGNMTYMTTFNRIVPKKYYRVTIYVRAKDVAPDATASLTLAWGAPDKPWLDKKFNSAVVWKNDGSGQWHKLTVVGIAPDVPKCYVRIMLAADKSDKGVFYWDEGAIEEVVEQ